MLRVTIEKLPGGDESRAKIIAIGEIVNDCSGTEGIGNYNCEFNVITKLHKDDDKGRFHCVAAGRVTDFHRKTRGPWELLVRALVNAIW